MALAHCGTPMYLPTCVSGMPVSAKNHIIGSLLHLLSSFDVSSSHNLTGLMIVLYWILVDIPYLLVVQV